MNVTGGLVIAPDMRVAASTSQATTREGGCTIARDGTVPTTGYMVATGNDDTRMVLKPAALTPDTVYRWMHRDVVSRALAEPEHYIGTWTEPHTATVLLEVSRRFDTADAALAYARRHNQRYVYDLATGACIDVVGVTA